MRSKSQTKKPAPQRPTAIKSMRIEHAEDTTERAIDLVVVDEVEAAAVASGPKTTRKTSNLI
jgi:hypothetical protein